MKTDWDWDFIMGRCTAKEAGLDQWPGSMAPEMGKGPTTIISPKHGVAVTWNRFADLSEEQRIWWGNKIDEIREDQMRNIYLSSCEEKRKPKASSKYRIKEYDLLHDVWILQKRVLWIFWVGISAGSKSKCEQFIEDQMEQDNE